MVFHVGNGLKKLLLTLKLGQFCFFYNSLGITIVTIGCNQIFLFNAQWLCHNGIEDHV